MTNFEMFCQYWPQIVILATMVVGAVINFAAIMVANCPEMRINCLVNIAVAVLYQAILCAGGFYSCCGWQ